MNLRYQWTPESAPPEDERLVLVWGYYLSRPEEGCWIDFVFHPTLGWDDGTDFVVTHWRDVEPPTERVG